MLIVIGLITETSIGQLFLAGIIPGLMIAAIFMAIIYFWVKIDPSVAPKASPAKWSERWKSVPEVLWPAIIFVVVIGGIMVGYFTPTEAGACGAFAVLILTILRRDMTFGKFVKSMTESLRMTVMIVFLIAASTALGHFITVTNLPMKAADWIIGLPLNRYVIMALILLIYEIGGSFIEDMAFVILATPIFFPAVVKLGFDPLWFGIIIGIVIMIGIVIPPVAVSVFVVKNITNVPIKTIYKGIAPFLISLVAVTVLLFIFPEIATWLPSKFFIR